MDANDNFVGFVVWNDGTKEKIKRFIPGIGTTYEFETSSGYYIFRQSDKTTKKRLPYNYEDEYYPWDDNCKQVKKIQYTVNIY